MWIAILAVAAAAEPELYSALGVWQRYVAGGCRAEARELRGTPWHPALARVIRNTPYAVQGRRFESEDLAAFFSRQSWYRPRDDAPLPPEAEVSCAQDLLAWEEQQRRTGPQLSSAMEARIVRDGFIDDVLAKADVHLPVGEEFVFEGATWVCTRAPEPVVPGYPCLGAGFRCPEQGACTGSSGP